VFNLVCILLFCKLQLILYIWLFTFTLFGSSPQSVVVIGWLLEFYFEDRVAEMSGLSYFTIQIQSWIFKTQSKSNHSTKFFKNVGPSPNKVRILIKSSFFTKNAANSFPIIHSKSDPDLKLLKWFTEWIEPKSQKS